MAVQLILKNSTVEDRRPTAAQLANGELSLNYNEAGPFLCCKDTDGNIQQLGGIKFNPDVPADAVTGTWWWNTATETLYVYDGTVWKEIKGGGGGGGTGITQILGDNGIDATVIGTVVTLNVDIDANKGLYFELDKLAINAGANLSFDADGKLQADIDTLSYKGTVDLTSDPVPAGGSAGDAFANIASGAMSAAWQTATGLGATTVSPGDLVVKTPAAWSYIPTGGAGVQTDLGLDNRGTETLDITSSTGADVTVPAATDALAGLMTAADKQTLDSGGTPNGGTGDRPTTPEIGDLYYDTDLDLLLVWNGTDWEPVSPPAGAGVWTRNVTTLAPTTDGDTVVITAADGTEKVSLNANGKVTATSTTIPLDLYRTSGVDTDMIIRAQNVDTKVFGVFKDGTTQIGGTLHPGQPNIALNADGSAVLAGNLDAVEGTFTDDVNAVNGQFSGDVNALTGNVNAVEGTFTDDVNALNAVITNDISLGGDIINTTVDGDQDIICDGSGLIEVTEYNLTPMEVVTKHDVGTAANEVPLNGFLGTLAYKDDLAITDGLAVADLPTAPTARVGNITRVTDGAAALAWGATVTGGGTAQYLVWYNGTNWTVLGA